MQMQWNPVVPEKLSPDEHFSQLLNLVEKYEKDEKQHEKLRQAYKLAAHSHALQKRVSGEPYVIHPIEAAKILAEIHMDIPTLQAALLHDVIEDTDYTYDDIKEKFGKTVADLVNGVTKLANISIPKETQGQPRLAQKTYKQAENLRKIFLAMARDIRVIFIKVADRLHNLKTLGALKPEKRKRKALETLEIFAPITGRLGMWEFKWQLEDLAFSHMEPELYQQIARSVAQRRLEREEIIDQVKNTIRKDLVEVGLTNVQISGRPKHLYSIYQKMNQQGRTVDEIFDLLAVRIIVDTVRECYQVLGIVHNLWMPFHDRFKDYIAMPKSNNYRSLHTTVYGPGNQPVEVQIRTWEMHQVNEYGIAAHWAYKEGASSDKNMTEAVFPWIRRILDWEGDSKDAREYIENLKLDLLESEVFVFTPNGDVVDLPAGSTPLDFAYRIHTEVGHRFTGAKVNSKIVPINYQLKNADIVEILTSKNGTPSRDWLKVARSNHAKNKIRQWFKKEQRDENIIRGKEMILAELRRHRIEVSLNNLELFDKIATKYNFVSAQDLFASVGYGESSPVTVLHRVQDLAPPEAFPQQAPEPVEESEEAQKRREKKKRKSRSPISVKGVENLLVRYAKCCSPVWGDDVIGYITLGKGVSIHRKNCKNFRHLATSPERVVEVNWLEPEKESLFEVELEIKGWDRPGLLSDTLTVVNDLKIKVTSTKAWTRVEKAVIKITAEVPSRKVLNALIKNLSRVKNVNKVFQVTQRSKQGKKQNGKGK